MRNISIGIVLAIMLATVGIYASSITGTNKTIGGTGAIGVSSPATATTAKWNLDTSGQVVSADVTWTPASASNYTITVNAGGVSGTATITGSGTVSRTDTVTLVSAVNATTVTTGEVVISET